ncbi:MAG: LptF/LptG family permease [Porphyromonadaceae bacterium]|nr:LptF/LptG family permease [Porphyromonadaceae bacterium]
MLKIVDRYILKGYLPMLLMSFLLCWLIVVMQFLWRYVDELVGKGLDVFIIAQILFYAAMSFLPMALPLGILLGSLMFFGNMGERLELLAMKASGMSLYRMMLPLFFAVSMLAVGLFAFQNDFMITSQVRMWTLLYSARFSNPELEIPERVFYNGIEGYSIYVKGRDRQHQGRMLDLMIYDHSEGSDKARIIRADSGRIVMDSGKTYITWRLYNGQSFENLEEPRYMEDIPTPRAIESFSFKEIVIPFDANFRKQGEEELSKLFIGKNLNQLQVAIDSTGLVLDSIRTFTESVLTNKDFSQRYSRSMPSPSDTSIWAKQQLEALNIDQPLQKRVNIDSIVYLPTLSDTLRMLTRSISDLRMVESEAEGRLYSDRDVFNTFRTNGQEWHRKFTLPAACLVFFFIGAPLGAIIRKGGIGMPVVASVLFFIIYYIIDTFGFNMTKNESVSVAFGMWLSALVLFPIGAFLTYKASLDSTSLNVETYVNLWRRLTGTYIPVRMVEPIEGEQEPDYRTVLAEARALLTESEDVLASKLMNKSVMHVLVNGEQYQNAPQEAYKRLEVLVNELRKVNHPLILTKTNDLPLLPKRLAPFKLPSTRSRGILLLALLPISLPLLLLLRIHRERLHSGLRAMNAALAELIPLLERSIESKETN